jgi:hypothetical protein
MITAQRSPGRKLCYRLWLIIGTMAALAAIGYGGFLIHERNEINCPISNSVSSSPDFRGLPIHFYSSFCNPSTNQTLPPGVNIDVADWCQVLGCGGQPVNEFCLLYLVGPTNSSCPAASPCALTCVESLPGREVAGIVLVVLGGLVLLIEFIVAFHRWKTWGDVW